jgi:hypothetical protein
VVTKVVCEAVVALSRRKEELTLFDYNLSLVSKQPMNATVAAGAPAGGSL